jgi:hypothetical protein
VILGGAIMNCEHIQRRLLRGGELSENDRAHLDSCAECRSFRDAVDQFLDPGLAAPQSEPTPAADTFVLAAAHHRLVTTSLTGAKRQRHWVWPALWRAAGALAAACVLVLIGAWGGTRFADGRFDGFATRLSTVAFGVRSLSTSIRPDPERERGFADSDEEDLGFSLVLLPFDTALAARLSNRDLEEPLPSLSPAPVLEDLLWEPAAGSDGTENAPTAAPPLGRSFGSGAYSPLLAGP